MEMMRKTEILLRKILRHGFQFFIVVLLVQCQPAEKNFNPILEISKNVDFSYAGYKHGEAEFNLKPKGWPVLNVVDFGAFPNDGKDDITAIQSAVDSAGKLNGAVVFFPPGRFDFDVHTQHEFVRVHHSNIVLLGSGEGIDGTMLLDHTPSTWPDMNKKWLAGMYPSFFAVGPDTARIMNFQFQPEFKLSTVKPAPVNSSKIVVTDTDNLVKGRTYLITMRDTGTALTKALTFPLEALAANYRSADDEHAYRFRQLITIADIRNDTVMLEEPLLWTLQSEFHPMLWALPEILDNVAIAGFHLKTKWNEPFWHHKNPEHDNGWDHIKLAYTVNTEIFNIRHDNASTAVKVHNCKNVTVRGSQITGNPGHNGFVVGGFSSRILVKNCKGGKQLHTFSMQGHVTGTVFFNSYSDLPSAIDLHGGLMVNNLFDNIYGPTMKNGGHPNNTPPAHARGLVIWNWYPGPFEPYKSRIQNVLVDLQTIPGVGIYGLQGLFQQPVFVSHQDSVISGQYKSKWGNVAFKKPSISSLYQYQMKQRSGKNAIY